MQGVRWDKGGPVRTGDYVFSTGKEIKQFDLEQEFVHRRIASAVNKVDFVTDRLLYIVLRGRWRSIIVVNVHVLSEEKSDKSEVSFMTN